MISYNRTLKIIYLFGLFVLLTGCAGSGTLVSTPIHTSLPPTHTPIPPTQILQPFVATFDGLECTISGPDEVPAGKYSILLKNLSDEKLALWTGLILDGHTYQDLLDLQSEPGKYYRKPDWLIHPTNAGFRVEPNGDKVYTWLFNDPGEYVIDIGWSLPESLWFCGSFNVVKE
jgi:hypothetical protein